MLLYGRTPSWADDLAPGSKKVKTPHNALQHRRLAPVVMAPGIPGGPDRSAQANGLTARTVPYILSCWKSSEYKSGRL